MKTDIELRRRKEDDVATSPTLHADHVTENGDGRGVGTRWMTRVVDLLQSEHDRMQWLAYGSASSFVQRPCSENLAHFGLSS